MRARAALWVPLLLAGCIDFVEISGPAGTSQLSLTLRSGNPGPADSLHVSGVLLVGGGGEVRFAEGGDTLRIAGQAVPVTRRTSGALDYEARLVLPQGALRRRVRVELPRPEGAPLPVPAFEVLVTMRTGPDTIPAAPGTDVVFPVRRGESRELVPRSESWRLVAMRGPNTAELRADAPLPSPLVLPAALLPAGPSRRMAVELFAGRSYSLGPAGAPPALVVTTEALLGWTVLLPNPS